MCFKVSAGWHDEHVVFSPFIRKYEWVRYIRHQPSQHYLGFSSFSRHQLLFTQNRFDYAKLFICVVGPLYLSLLFNETSYFNFEFRFRDPKIIIKYSISCRVCRVCLVSKFKSRKYYIFFVSLDKVKC